MRYPMTSRETRVKQNKQSTYTYMHMQQIIYFHYEKEPQKIYG